MYSTCLFCRADLGANEMLEHFPVGRRLAYDPKRGRLWVVCPSCRQWCLSPLDERWEAVEEAERLYRGTRLRAATDQVGLARLRDGTDLVRIGEPLRPEMAAWRYGARFGTRWRRHLGLTVAGAALVGGYIVAGPVMGLIAGGLGAIPWNLWLFGSGAIRRRRIVARLDGARGPIAVTDEQLEGARLLPAEHTGSRWRLAIPHVREDLRVGSFTLRATRASDVAAELEGDAALAAARVILPRLNRNGGSSRAVSKAVELLELEETPDASFARMAREHWEAGATTLDSVETPHRLALEMAAHEEIERRALEGELAALEAAWREAEEIAAIADNLTLPERVAARLERMRR